MLLLVEVLPHPQDQPLPHHLPQLHPHHQQVNNFCYNFCFLLLKYDEMINKRNVLQIINLLQDVDLLNGLMTNGVTMKTTMLIAVMMVELAASITFQV